FALQVLQALSQRELEIVEEVARHPFLACGDLYVLFDARSTKAMARSLRFLQRMHVLRPVKPQWARDRPSEYCYMPDKLAILILHWHWGEHVRSLQKRLARLKQHLGALAHTVEINRFFLHLLAAARSQADHALEVWRSEAQSLMRIQGRRGHVILRPDGYGVYRTGTARVRFFLEWDRGNSIMPKYRAKFARYAAYYDAA